jgi:hypothetical protein
MKYRCISLWQPWASLIGRGKGIETRSWQTPYRGPLAIHAAKTQKAMKQCFSEPFRTVLQEADLWEDVSPSKFTITMPFGSIVAVCNLVECRSTSIHNAVLGPVPQQWVLELNDREKAFGDYSINRYGWVLEDIRVLDEPIPMRGQQGMWDVELDI